MRCTTMRHLTTAIPIALAVAPWVVQAQEPADMEPDSVSLDAWPTDEIYADGWSAEGFIDAAAVVGAEGAEIGGVENHLVHRDGRILSVGVEVGGFIDIGDIHVAVPWHQFEFAQGTGASVVPVTEENVNDGPLFGEWGHLTAEGVESVVQVVDDDPEIGPSVWRTSDLINDYVRLGDGVDYGCVDDLIFSKDGTLTAVIIERDVAYGVGGPYAFPFYGYGFDPHSPYYNLPNGDGDIAELELFEYDRLATAGAVGGD